MNRAKHTSQRRAQNFTPPSPAASTARRPSRHWTPPTRSRPIENAREGGACQARYNVLNSLAFHKTIPQIPFLARRSLKRLRSAS